MSIVRLYIDGQEVDLDQSKTDIAVQYSIERVNPAGDDRKGRIKGATVKRNIVAPATKTNREVFGFAEIPSSTNREKYYKLDARLEADGVPVLQGQASLGEIELKCTDQGFEPSQYKISLVGTNADWFAEVGNQLIRSLGWGNVVVSFADVEANRDPLTSEYAFILMKWRDWREEDRVRHTEFSPAIFVWQILSKAFASRGYRLESPFVSDPLNRLVIPIGLNLDADYLKNFVNLRASSPSPNSISVVVNDPGETKITFTNETTPPNFDFGGNYTIGTYTVPLTALYQIVAEMNITVTATSGDPLGFNQLELVIKRNGDVVSIFDLAAGHDWNVPFVLNDSINFEYIEDLTEGDTIEFFVKHDGITFTMSLAGSFAIDSEKEQFEINESFNLQFLIPNSWYVRDLIRDLTYIFNLAWETDVAGRVVYAYPKDDYSLRFRANATGAITTSAFPGFFQSSNPYDLGTRNVQGAKMEIISAYKESMVHCYATDDDTTNAEEERRGVNIYSGGYNFPADRFEPGLEFLYSSFFAKTLHIQDTAITSGGTFGAQIPLLYGGDYNQETGAKPNYFLAPRLLYYAGRRAGLDGRVRLYNVGTSATSAFDYPAAFMVNYNDPSAGDFNLSFSDENTNFSQTMPGLFKSLWMQEYKRREIGKLYEFEADWNPADIANLSFRRRAMIGNARYILQQIDYNPKSNAPQKTVILYDEKPNVTDLAKATNTISLVGATPQPGTVVGSGSGLVGAGSVTVNIQSSRTIFLNHNSNVLTLAGDSGILSVSSTAAGVSVFQNGQKILEGVQYTISGATITVDSATHWDGSNYEVVINGVTKG